MTLHQEGPSLTRPATPAQIGAAIAAAATRIEMISIGSIATSTTNPRKTFEGIEELAASIEAQGLLQPIVVRPAKKDGQFELIAGERRFRALKLLKRSEAPCRVMVANDGQAMAMQILENLQREDIKPMEEAKAFAALQDAEHTVWTPQAIAKAVGKTDRFVQQRIQMARGLSTKAQEVLAEGGMKVELARTLATAPKPVQDQMLKTFGNRLEHTSADRLRELILDAMVPVEIAEFKLELYKGGYHEDGKKRYFTDVEQFNKLQLVAAHELAFKLKLEWPGAKVVDRLPRYDWSWGDTGQPICYAPDNKRKAALDSLKVPREKLTALVAIERGRIKALEGIAANKVFPKEKGSLSGNGTNGESAAQRRYRQAYNEAVFGAVGENVEIAMRLLLMRFIDGTTRFTYDHGEAKKGHAAILAEHLIEYVGTSFDHPKAVKLWALVQALKAEDVVRMVSRYTARSLSWQANHGDGKKPPPIVALMATEAKATLPVFDAAPPAKAKAAAAALTAKHAAEAGLLKPAKVKAAKPKTPAAKKKAAKSRKHQ